MAGLGTSCTPLGGGGGSEGGGGVTSGSAGSDFGSSSGSGDSMKLSNYGMQCSYTTINVHQHSSWACTSIIYLAILILLLPRM